MRNRGAAGGGTQKARHRLRRVSLVIDRGWEKCPEPGYAQGPRPAVGKSACGETMGSCCTSRERSKWRTRPRMTPNKNNQSKDWLFLFGGDGEIRTLAPVSRPTPLAGAPRHHLSTSPKWQRSFFRYSVLCTSRRFLKWRRRWDSNPRNIAVQRFSRPPP